MDLGAGENIDWTVIDPSTKQTESTGERIIDQYRKAGLLCQEGNNAVRDSIARIRQLLQPDENHPFPSWHPRSGEMGAPRLFIFDTCTELIFELQQYQWKQVKPGQVDKEVPLAKHDHAIAALRYILMRSPRLPVETIATGTYDRFMQIVQEMEGMPPLEPGSRPLGDVIGNQALRV